MTAFASWLIERIRRQGPLSWAEVMPLWLMHPQLGLYARGEGPGRHFTTSAELLPGPLGALLARWCAAVWERLGRPDPVLVVELGPGTGRLAAALREALAAMPGLGQAAALVLVEPAHGLMQQQQAVMAAGAVGPAGPVPVTWVRDLALLPAGAPAIILGNEVLDALPVHCLERGPRGAWHEILVGEDPAGGGLALMRDPQVSARGWLVPPEAQALPEGHRLEVSPAAIGMVAAIAARILEPAGAALLIDYGRTPGEVPGHTLQAVRHHRRIRLLEAPGESDITAHVDFPTLMRVAGEAGLVPALARQAAFLAAGGLRVPAEGGLDVERVLDPRGLGSFLVLGMARPGVTLPWFGAEEE